eukprot:5640325-Amphidinium_carterae.1
MILCHVPRVLASKCRLRQVAHMMEAAVWVQKLHPGVICRSDILPCAASWSSTEPRFSHQLLER